MSDPDAAWNRRPSAGNGYWRRLGAALPMRTALFAVASVWILGCVWSFQEQSNFAASKGFVFPHLLPLVIDGFAVSMAGVAWAASLDARPAVPARLATVVAVAASSASNGVWAYLRANQDMVTVTLGVAVPVAANLAFEVLLAELRRQVQRRRGLPPPVAVPYPRLIRFVLAPWATFFAWRTMVLEITAMEHTIAPSARTPRNRPADDEPDPVPATASVSRVDATTPVQPVPPPPAARHAAPAPALAPSFSAPLANAPAPPSEPAHAAPNPPNSQPAPSEPTMAEAPPAPAHPEPPPPPSAPAPARHVRPVPPPTEVARQADAGSVATRQRTRYEPEPSRNGEQLTNGTAPDNETDLDPDNDNETENGFDPNRPVDPRVEQLARHLAATDDSEDLTGERVSELLNINASPRTGRRLLGQARELLHRRRAQAEYDGQGFDSGLSVIGGR
ncbi:DUF2637 domain-containing protein [Pseudonocardia acaciae]|uniref:DUF2637 domain-containing protein n=1 Tax=Pseudonocardia acaciae TaxID=551276 RepID=UPI00048CE157|nr:DUF2637 domain-containing protein [Pseudonocardia acaciae]